MRRAAAVAASAALAAGLAATFAAVAGRPAPAGIDPQQAVLDGCRRDFSAEVRREIPTWVYVNDHDAQPTGPPPPQQRLEGVVSSRFFPQLASHPTEEDLPTVHRAYDFNFDVLPHRAYLGLLGGDPAAHTGNFEGKGASSGRIHVEREQTALPRFAWPVPGDRVAMVGSWVWDCGHWLPGGERTEIHSYRALWVARSGGGEGDLVVSNDKTYAGVEADCAHRAKLVVPFFQSCLSTENRWADVRGNYRFQLRLPPRPSRGSRVRVRIVDMGSSRGTLGARATVRGRTVDVSLPVLSNPTGPLLVAQRVLAGWTRARRPEHLRVRFVRLLVRRAMDPGCANGRPACGSKETTHGEQGSAPPGEWNVYVEAAGSGRPGGMACCGRTTARSSTTAPCSTSSYPAAARGASSPSRGNATSARSVTQTAPDTRWRRARARASTAASRTATTARASSSTGSLRRRRRSASTVGDRCARSRRARW